jgi:hypothetical protein
MGWSSDSTRPAAAPLLQPELVSCHVLLVMMMMMMMVVLTLTL